MAVTFDFQTISVNIDHSLDEYTAIPVKIGIHVWEDSMGDRSKILRFRHEHAHFTSYMASGLCDLYGVFNDYCLAFLYAVLRTYQDHEAVALPLITKGSDLIDDAQKETINRAWKHLNLLRAFLFGFGGRDTLGTLTDSEQHNLFWETYYDERFMPIVRRFLRLTSARNPMSSGRDANAALPEILLESGRRRLTSRSVMEAYAITIELFNVHFRSVLTDATFYSSSPERDPGPLYTAAIEYALEKSELDETASLAQYLSGTAPHATYEYIACISFAAMQVPVLQDLEGEVVIDGSLFSACPAVRFQRLVDAYRLKQIPTIPDVGRGAETQNIWITWLEQCGNALGDIATMKLCRKAHERCENDPALRSKVPGTQSMIESCWAAHANLYRNPGEYILDGGLFAERWPCQVRYLRTSDAKLISALDNQGARASYIFDYSGLVLEAAVFGSSWDSVWAKMPEIPAVDRARMIQSCWASSRWTFRDLPVAGHKMPAIDLRTDIVGVTELRSTDLGPDPG